MRAVDASYFCLPRARLLLYLTSSFASCPTAVAIASTIEERRLPLESLDHLAYHPFLQGFQKSFLIFNFAAAEFLGNFGLGQ